MMKSPFPTSVSTPAQKAICASMILRDAAKLIADELTKRTAMHNRTAGCSAIHYASNTYAYKPGITEVKRRAAQSRAHVMFRSLFQNSETYWFGHKCTNAEQEHRIMALLLTAELAESIGE